MNFASRTFWKRLHVAFAKRGILPGCNSLALVLVMDRHLDTMHFKDGRERVLQRPHVIQRDHGKNVTYSFLIGEGCDTPSSTSEDGGTQPEFPVNDLQSVAK